MHWHRDDNPPLPTAIRIAAFVPATSMPGTSRASRAACGEHVAEGSAADGARELETMLAGAEVGYIHDFVLEMPRGGDAAAVIGRARMVERAIAAVLEGRAENDPFNQLIVATGLEPQEVVLLRAWFRYLRQTGLSYSMLTVVEALRSAPEVTKGMPASWSCASEASTTWKLRCTTSAPRFP